MRSGGALLPVPSRAYLFDDAVMNGGLRDAYALGAEFRYLSDGDVVRIDPPRNSIAALYRRGSESNSFLVTERCDNYCLMCSQPPKQRDDSWLVDEMMEAIPLISRDAKQIGITGGEPALLGERLVETIRLLEVSLPTTSVHVLSNGRAFADAKFACAIGEVRHHDLMFGIPLYSDVPEEHDFVVQARGAFDETIRGIMNLKRAGVSVELRFVIHAETCRRLAEFARFVTRNLLFVDHLALMGLELMGFAKTNLEQLWVDPVDYQSELAAAVRVLRRAQVPTSIYNHQLCVLDGELHDLARKSISDWKNLYVEECERCERRSDCGGFFASATHRRSRGITPMRAH